MATIKNLITNFCYRINQPAPAAIVGVASPAERQYLSLFQYIGDNLRNRPFQWPQLKRGHTFTTTTDIRDYQLPGDFYRLLDSTQWDTTNNWPMRGPISDYNMAIREFAVVSLQTRKAFRIIGPTNYLYNLAPYNQTSAGYFQIDPVGANNTDELFLGYISCNWIWPQNWSPALAYNTQDKVSGNGYPYICVTAGTSALTPIPSSGTNPIVDGTVVWNVLKEPTACSYELNPSLTDNWICLFDDDLMIDGMVWAYKRIKGQDYQELRVDWENAVKGAFSRFNGPSRCQASDEIDDYYEWPNVQNGSWNV